MSQGVAHPDDPETTMTGHEETMWYRPSWVLASVAAVFIVSSLIVERGIYFIGRVLQKRKQRALEKAFEKIKEELMMVGFISLALTMGQRKITEICIPEGWSKIMSPCQKPHGQETLDSFIVRRLATDQLEQTCREGKVPFVGLEDLHQLHIYIFVLAIVHVVYSVVTMALGIWKVNQWKAWEETSKQTEKSSHGVIRYTRETTFVQRHASGIWSRNIFLAYVAAFFQQFIKSVTETDYMTLRHSFIMNHMGENANYDFHNYILRSLEHDFKHVVGISPVMWGYTVLLMLLNVHGWKTHFWISFVPFTFVLVIGMKLRHIITMMAIRITEKNSVIEGIPTVMLRDKYFWFNHPRWTIYLVHFILFQNSSELSLFLWSKFTFPQEICLQKDPYLVILRLIIGVLGQAICSFTTLPIHALVSQMGSHLQKTIFKPQTQLALKKWKNVAKEKVQKRRNMSLQDVDRNSLESDQGHGDVEAHAQGDIHIEYVKDAHLRLVQQGSQG